MSTPRRDLAAILSERHHEWFVHLPPDWYAEALCAQVDPDLFWPERGGSTRDARKVCGMCPVREQCLEYALGNRDFFGIWGGVTERERRKIVRARRAS